MTDVVCEGNTNIKGEIVILSEDMNYGAQDAFCSYFLLKIRKNMGL